MTPNLLFIYTDEQRFDTLAVADPLRTIVSADGRWKLNVSPALGQHELYDLVIDPGDCENRYGNAGTTAERRTDELSDGTRT